MATTYPQMPMQIMSLLNDMSFIANVGVGRKLCVHAREYSDVDWYGWAKRRLYHEKPEHAITFIQSVCRNANELIIVYPMYKQMILQNAVQMYNGILQLKTTYDSNTNIHSQLSTIIIQLNLMIPNDMLQPLATTHSSLLATTTSVPVTTTSVPVTTTSIPATTSVPFTTSNLTAAAIAANIDMYDVEISSDT